MKKEPIIIVHVTVDNQNISRMEMPDGAVAIIPFTGTVEGELFSGKVMPGAADVQITNPAGVRHMCAQYMLEGTDYKGKSCHLFVENNGAFPEDGGMIQTTPMILTDSPNLKFLEETTLRGLVDNEDGNLLIRIFANQC